MLILGTDAGGRTMLRGCFGGWGLLLEGGTSKAGVWVPYTPAGVIVRRLSDSMKILS
jgi:hypothetical protein